MIALVVEGAIGDDDVGRMRILMSFWFFSSLLLRANHYQRELTCRLPGFILFGNLFRIQRNIFRPLIISRFRAVLGVVDLIFCIMGAWIQMLLFLLMDDSSSSKNVEACLCFSDELPILVLLKADILFLDMFMIGFVLVD